MDDDLIKPAPVQNIPNTSPITEEREDEAANVRIFDITPDLNISPAKDDDESSTVPSIPSIATISVTPTNKPPVNPYKPKPIEVDLAGQVVPEKKPEPVATPAPAVIKTQPVPVIAPITASSPTPQPTVSQYGPANPPAKTIGYTTFSFTKPADQTKNPPPPATLQEAVSSAISSINPSKDAVKIPAKPAEIQNDPNVKPIRTYERDFAEAMSKRHLSTASFTIAEDKRNQEIKSEMQKNAEVKPVNVPVKPTIAKEVSVNIPPKENVPMNIPLKEKIPVIRKIENVEIQKPPTISAGTLTDANNVNANNNIAISDRVRVMEQKPPSNVAKNLILTLLSLILVGGGAYSAYYFYQKSPLALIKKPAPVAQPQFSAPIIKADSQRILNIDNLNKPLILSSIQTEINKAQNEKTIKEILLAKTTNGTTARVSAKEILETANIATPDIFSRSLGTNWMLGVYAGTNGQKNVFVITTNDFFQNAFAGIIQWEKTMADDLGPYLYSAPVVSNIVASSTASTTETVELTNFSLQGKFKDHIIKNKDVREYVADNGHIIFLYSFISNDKLVITNSEGALQEIVTRLEKTAFVR